MLKIVKNRLDPQVDQILSEEQAGFRNNRSTIDKIFNTRLICDKHNLQQQKLYHLFIDLHLTEFGNRDVGPTSLVFNAGRGKMAEILKAYGIPEKIINAIMIAYKDTKSIVRSDDGDTEFINITGGVLQGDTLAPFLFIICLYYVLKMSLDRDNVLGLPSLRERAEDIQQ